MMYLIIHEIFVLVKHSSSVIWDTFNFQVTCLIKVLEWSNTTFSNLNAFITCIYLLFLSIYVA